MVKGAEIPKGYKLTEVGVIPEDWESKKIIDVNNYVDYRGKTPHKTKDGRFLVTAKNIRMGHIDYEISKEYVAEDDYEVIMRRGRPKYGDILITTEAPLGNVAQIDNDKIALAQRIIKYSAKNNEIINDYFKFYLLSPRFQKILDENSSGSTAKGIKGSILHKLPVILPPIKEQISISKVLSDADALIASLEKLIAKKRAIKQGAMQELLTGKKRLPGFTGKWEVKKLGEIGKTYGGLSGKSKEDFINGVYPYIPFMNIIKNPIINKNYLDYVNLRIYDKQNKVLKGDLFFNGSSETPEEVGMCSVILDDIQNLFLNSFCFGFRLHNPLEVYGLFLAYYFRSSYGRNLFYSLAQGATRYNLSKNNFLKMEIVIPFYEEQIEIAKLISDMDNEIESLETKLNKYKALKQGMMQNLLTGKIRLI